MKVYAKYLLFVQTLFWLFTISLTPSPRGYFWELTTPKARLYLLGSIHVGRSDFYPLDSNWIRSFKSCENVVVELNVKAINPFTMLNLATFQDTTRLEHLLSKEVFSLLDSIFASYGIPKSQFNRFRPWFAISTLMNLSLVRLSAFTQYGIENHFLNQIDSNQKILELETLEEQVSFLETIFNEAPDKFIKYYIQEFEKATDLAQKLLDNWVKGDESEFRSIFFEEIQNDPEMEKFEKVLIAQRNQKMLDKIIEYIERGGCYFVIVGAGHCLGEDGIVSQLKKRGYKIERK